MAASPQLDTAMQMFRSLTEKFETLADVEDFRAAYEEFTSQFQPEEGTTYERVGAGGVPADWAVAPGAADDPVMIWLHGGGYMIGSMRTHRPTLSRLSKASGWACAWLGTIALAPENPFPAAVQDTVAAYRWLLANGTDPKKIVIGGGLGGRRADRGRPRGPAVHGRADAGGGHLSLGAGRTSSIPERSITTKAEIDPILSREMLDLMAQTYVGGRDPGTPLASPLLCRPARAAPPACPGRHG